MTARAARATTGVRLRGGQGIQITGDDRRAARSADAGVEVGCAIHTHGRRHRRPRIAALQITAAAAIAAPAVGVGGCARPDVAIQARIAAHPARPAHRRDRAGGERTAVVGIDIAAGAAPGATSIRSDTGVSIHISRDACRSAIAACARAEVGCAADRERAAHVIGVEMTATAAAAFPTIESSGDIGLSTGPDIAIQGGATAHAAGPAHRRDRAGGERIAVVGIDTAAGAALGATGRRSDAGVSIHISRDACRSAIAARARAEVGCAADRERAAHVIGVELTAVAATAAAALPAIESSGDIGLSTGADVANQRRAVARPARAAQRRKRRAQRHLISIGVNVAAAAALAAAGVNRRVGASGDAVRVLVVHAPVVKGDKVPSERCRAAGRPSCAREIDRASDRRQIVCVQDQRTSAATAAT